MDYAPTSNGTFESLPRKTIPVIFGFQTSIEGATFLCGWAVCRFHDATPLEDGELKFFPIYVPVQS